MAKNKHKRAIQRPPTYFFHLGSHSIRVILDKVLLFRYARRVHGRFWGLAAITVISIGFSICFLIRPDLIRADTAFSDFGTDVRTAPYYAGAVFFAAYALWRWRNYLHHTWKRDMPTVGFLTLTILGLYITALMPITWRPWPYRFHLLGVSLAFLSMVLTVMSDGVLTRTRRTSNMNNWRLLRTASAMLIVAGGWITLGSSEPVSWFNMSFLGEMMIWAGYGLWICFKTYQGEGSRSAVGRMFRHFVLID